MEGLKALVTFTLSSWFAAIYKPLHTLVPGAPTNQFYMQKWPGNTSPEWHQYLGRQGGGASNQPHAEQVVSFSFSDSKWLDRHYKINIYLGRYWCHSCDEMAFLFLIFCTTGSNQKTGWWKCMVMMALVTICIPYSRKLSREKTFAKNTLFAEKTFTDCSLLQRQRCHAPKFCAENFHE